MSYMQTYGKLRPGRRLAPHRFELDPGTPGRFCTCGLPWRNSVHLADPTGGKR